MNLGFLGLGPDFALVAGNPPFGLSLSLSLSLSTDFGMRLCCLILSHYMVPGFLKLSHAKAALTQKRALRAQ